MSRWFVQVGGLAELAQQGEDFIKWSDTAVEKTPLVREALAIQQTIFDIADEIGVGEEVRAMVYSLRGAQYLGTAAANLGLIGPGGLAAGTGAVGLVASFSAFGAAAAGGAVVVAVVVVIDWLFGDDDDADAARKRKAKAKERLEDSLQELLEPMSLLGMADEQDKVAAFTPPNGTLDPQQWEALKADRERAKRMAQFYRIASVKLSARQRRFFEALINLGRWGQAHQAFSGQSQKVQEALSVAVYETGWKPSNSKYPGGKAPTLPGTEGPFGTTQYDMTKIVPYSARLVERVGQAQEALAQFSDGIPDSKGLGWLFTGVLVLGGALAWRHPALISRIVDRAAGVAAKVNPW